MAFAQREHANLLQIPAPRKKREKEKRTRMKNAKTCKSKARVPLMQIPKRKKSFGANSSKTKHLKIEICFFILHTRVHTRVVEVLASCFRFLL